MYRLKHLKDQKWTAKAFDSALARLHKRLDAVAGAYAIPVIAKSGLDTILGFDTSQIDIERAFELARVSQDAGVFDYSLISSQPKATRREPQRLPISVTRPC